MTGKKRTRKTAKAVKAEEMARRKARAAGIDTDKAAVTVSQDAADQTPKEAVKKRRKPYADPADPVASEAHGEGTEIAPVRMDQTEPHQEGIKIGKSGKSATASLGRPDTTPGPRKYTPQLADAICHRIMCGETLTSICRDPAMPSHGTVMGWVRQRREFASLYAQARRHQQDAWADMNIDIADFSAGDYARLPSGEYQLDRGGNPIFLKEAPQRSKLKIEARQWTMERVNREQYGDRIGVDMTGAVENKSDSELLADVVEALQTAGMAADDLADLLSKAKSAGGRDKSAPSQD